MKICIKNFTLDLIVGIFDFERTARQTIHFDIDIYLDENAGANDDIDNTLDYNSLLQELTKHLEDTQYNLLETLVNDTAGFILNKSHVRRVTVACDKGRIFENVDKVAVCVDLTK